MLLACCQRNPRYTCTLPLLVCIHSLVQRAAAHSFPMDPTPSPELRRPLGGTEYSWYRAVPTGTGVTVLAILLRRPPPLSLLRSSLLSLLSSHPLLSSALTGPTPSISPSHSPSPAQTLDLTPQALPFPSLLERELNLNPWAADPSAPIFHAALYSTPDDRCIISLKFHTGFCDRTSGVRLLKELLELVGGGGGEAAREEGDGVGVAVEDLIPEKDRWKPFWARGMDLVGYSLNSLRTSQLGFVDAAGERESAVMRMVMGEAETRRLMDGCKARGIKLSGALLAAGLIAIYSSKNLENHQTENYSVVTLIDCRKYLDPVLTDHNVGFYHSAIINTHSMKGGEGLWEVAKRCHEAYSTAMSNKKHLTDIGGLNFLMCKAIENPQLTPSSSLRTAVLSVFEETMFYESSEAQRSLGVEDYVGCASVHGVGPSIAIFDTIRDGQLDCACVYPTPLHSRNQIEDLVEHMKRILVEGGVTI